MFTAAGASKSASSAASPKVEVVRGTSSTDDVTSSLSLDQLAAALRDVLSGDHQTADNKKVTKRVKKLLQSAVVHPSLSAELLKSSGLLAAVKLATTHAIPKVADYGERALGKWRADYGDL